MPLRKLGFGMGLDETQPADPMAWVESQLSAEMSNLGYAHAEGNDPIEILPDRFNLDLTARVTRSLDYSNERRKIRKSKLSAADKGAALGEARDKYETRFSDQTKFVLAPVLGQDHFKRRLSHFWLNHFTAGFATTASNYLIGHYADEAIYGHLNGSFADMLYAVETHPAMLTYLDNIYNIGEKSQRNRSCNCAGFNDNLAREAMELHTVSPARNYTEDDIRDAAKIFAGWGAPFDEKMPERVKDYWQCYLKSRAEPGKKEVLGQEFAPGSGALRELLDLLASDPMTAQYLSRKLALHFIGDAATPGDISAIQTAWETSNGDLPTVHKAVAKAALNSESKKFLWPLTWLFQLVRISGSRLFGGFEETLTFYHEKATRMPTNVMNELGMDFWSIRQPDGYSDHRRDWISSEHFDRRIRFAQMTFQAGDPKRSVDDMIDLTNPSERTKAAIAKKTSQVDRFVILTCSKEFFEV